MTHIFASEAGGMRPSTVRWLAQLAMVDNNELTLRGVPTCEELPWGRADHTDSAVSRHGFEGDPIRPEPGNYFGFLIRAAAY